MRAGIAIAALAAGMHAMSAWAALGGSVDSVQVDGTMMRAKAQAMHGADSYAVHEIQLPSGTVVREYAGADGTIFAVAWDGPTMPDIRQLLGQYFERYASALQGRHRALRHVTVRQAGLVVQSHGRMGAFSGQAYLPQALPPGVTPDALQ